MEFEEFEVFEIDMADKTGRHYFTALDGFIVDKEGITLIKSFPYSIEGDSNEFKRLEENLKINNCNNVIPINAALTDTVGEIYFANNHAKPDSKTMESCSSYAYSGKCKSLTINELIRKYSIDRIDFLKLDIEGSEYDVFKDASWLNKVKIISMELHKSIDNKDTQDILTKLKQNNFLVSLKKSSKIDTYCFARCQN